MTTRREDSDDRRPNSPGLKPLGWLETTAVQDLPTLGPLPSIVELGAQDVRGTSPVDHYRELQTQNAHAAPWHLRRRGKKIVLAAAVTSGVLLPAQIAAADCSESDYLAGNCSYDSYLNGYNAENGTDFDAEQIQEDPDEAYVEYIAEYNAEHGSDFDAEQILADADADVSTVPEVEPVVEVESVVVPAPVEVEPAVEVESAPVEVDADADTSAVPEVEPVAESVPVEVEPAVESSPDEVVSAPAEAESVPVVEVPPVEVDADAAYVEYIAGYNAEHGTDFDAEQILADADADVSAVPEVEPVVEVESVVVPAPVEVDADASAVPEVEPVAESVPAVEGNARLEVEPGVEAEVEPVVVVESVPVVEVPPDEVDADAAYVEYIAGYNAEHGTDFDAEQILADADADADVSAVPEVEPVVVPAPVEVEPAVESSPDEVVSAPAEAESVVVVESVPVVEVPPDEVDADAAYVEYIAGYNAEHGTDFDAEQILADADVSAVPEVEPVVESVPVEIEAVVEVPAVEVESVPVVEVPPDEVDADAAYAEYIAGYNAEHGTDFDAAQILVDADTPEASPSEESEDSPSTESESSRSGFWSDDSRSAELDDVVHAEPEGDWVSPWPESWAEFGLEQEFGPVTDPNAESSSEPGVAEDFWGGFAPTFGPTVEPAPLDDLSAEDRARDCSEAAYLAGDCTHSEYLRAFDAQHGSSFASDVEFVADETPELSEAPWVEPDVVEDLSGGFAPTFGPWVEPDVVEDLSGGFAPTFGPWVEPDVVEDLSGGFAPTFGPWVEPDVVEDLSGGFAPTFGPWVEPDVVEDLSGGFAPTFGPWVEPDVVEDLSGGFAPTFGPWVEPDVVEDLSGGFAPTFGPWVEPDVVEDFWGGFAPTFGPWVEPDVVEDLSGDLAPTFGPWVEPDVVEDLSDDLAPTFGPEQGEDPVVFSDVPSFDTELLPNELEAGAWSLVNASDILENQFDDPAVQEFFDDTSLQVGGDILLPAGGGKAVGNLVERFTGQELPDVVALWEAPALWGQAQSYTDPHTGEERQFYALYFINFAGGLAASGTSEITESLPDRPRTAEVEWEAGAGQVYRSGLVLDIDAVDADNLDLVQVMSDALDSNGESLPAGSSLYVSEAAGPGGFASLEGQNGLPINRFAVVGTGWEANEEGRNHLKRTNLSDGQVKIDIGTTGTSPVTNEQGSAGYWFGGLDWVPVKAKTKHEPGGVKVGTKNEVGITIAATRPYEAEVSGVSVVFDPDDPEQAAALEAFQNEGILPDWVSQTHYEEESHLNFTRNGIYYEGGFNVEGFYLFGRASLSKDQIWLDYVVRTEKVTDGEGTVVDQSTSVYNDTSTVKVHQNQDPQSGAPAGHVYVDVAGDSAKDLIEAYGGDPSQCAAHCKVRVELRDDVVADYLARQSPVAQQAGVWDLAKLGADLSDPEAIEVAKEILGSTALREFHFAGIYSSDNHFGSGRPIPEGAFTVVNPDGSVDEIKRDSSP